MVDSLQRAGIKKAAAERSLASLVEKGSVTKKEYGKAKIFIASQKNIALPNEDETNELKQQIGTLSTQVDEKTGSVRAKRARVAELKAQLSLAEARQRAEKLREEIGGKETKLEALGDGSALMSKEDKLKLETNYYTAITAWKKYRRIVGDIVGQVSEGMGKKVADLYDDIGIETDVEAKTKLEDFPNMSNPSGKKTHRSTHTHLRAAKRSRPS